jgi:hypothetical protein
MATESKKPLDNLTYDIVTILHEKSQALEAYDSYLEDAKQDPEVVQLLQDIRHHDEDDIQKLRFELGRLLGQTASQGGAVASGPDVGRAV